MPRWTRQTLGCAVFAMALLAGPIVVERQEIAAAAAVVPPVQLSHITLPEQMRLRAVQRTFGSDARRQFECLALNIYWESKSEPIAGKRAVAAVTLNRLLHPAYPNSICGVVKQGVGNGPGKCQFSWACDRRSDHPRDAEAWQNARQIAYEMLFFDHTDPTGGAMYFHATYVKPAWARSMVRVARIGKHLFYRYREPMSAEEDTRRSRS